MGISIYSLASAVLFLNIGLLLIRMLRCNTDFLVRNSTTALMILLLFSIIRVLMPLDLSSALIIQSKTILPLVIKIFNIGVLNRFSVGSILLIIWLIGAVVVIATAIYNFMKEMHKIRHYTVVKDNQAERVVETNFADQAIIVVTSPDVEVPKVTGLFKAHIYIPLLSITDEELKMILLHEFQHIKGKDIYIKLLYILLKAVFWWNPIVHAFQNEVEGMLELRCDLAVTKKMSNNMRIAYLEAILKVIKQSKIERINYPINVATLLNSRVQGFTKQRFEVVLNRMVRTEKRINMRSIILASTAFICSYFIIIQPVFLPPSDEMEQFVEITDNNAYIVIEEDGIMKLFVENEFYDIITQEEIRVPPYNKLHVVERGGKQ